MEINMQSHSPFSAMRFNRRAFVLTSASLFASPNFATAAAQAGTEEKFNYLSKNGNSNCSTQFRDSILIMAPPTRVQGSCCGPMALHRYREQVEGLKEYAKFPEIPPDPYDIDPGLAARMLKEYKVELNRVNLTKYNAAMDLSAEGGPCCCKCWRWEVLGGMGKVLIRDRQIDGKTLAKIWDLTDGCGGDEHAH
jgi:hypothetical protein